MSQSCYQTSNVPVNSTELAPCAGTAGTGTISLCCTPLGICLTNGLCATNDGPTSLFYSGGCTDSTYKAAICPKYCTTPGDSYVVECSGPDSPVKDGDFCCSTNGNSDCCQNATNALGLAASVSWAVAGVSATNSMTSASSSQTPAPSSRTLTLIHANSGAATPSSTSGSASGTADHDPKRPLALGLGLGLGIPLVMFALLVLWRYFKSAQSKDRPRQLSESMRGITTTDAKSAAVNSSDPSDKDVSELPNSQTFAVSSPSNTSHIKWKSVSPVEMGTDTEVPPSKCEGSKAPESRIVPDMNPRRPRDGFLGAITATQASGYLPRQ